MTTFNVKPTENHHLTAVLLSYMKLHSIFQLTGFESRLQMNDNVSVSAGPVNR